MRVNVVYAIMIMLLVGTTAGAQGKLVAERLRVRTMIGKVSVRSSGAANWRSARVGMPVRAGWDIRTFVESSVELEYESGTLLKIGENSVVTIAGALAAATRDVTRSSVKVSTGDVWANVKKLTSRQSTFQFETPTAVASIRGTRLGLSVDSQGATRLDVYEGTVLFRPRGSGVARPITERMRAIARPARSDLEVVDFSDTHADSVTHNQPAMIDPFSGDTLAAGRGREEADTAALDTTTAQAGDTAPDSLSPDSATADSVAGEGNDDHGGAGDTGAIDSMQGSGRENPVLDILYPKPGDGMTETPVVVTGRTRPGATATIGGAEVAVGSDGYFAGPFRLEAGVNTIPVVARTGEWEISREVTVDYHPPLWMKVNNLVDRMEVGSRTIHIDIEVSAGAGFSVNGVEGATRLELEPGENTVTIQARDERGGEEEREYTVIYTPSGEFELSVVRPTPGDTVREPMIPISGSTAPEAMVTVNGASVVVGATGFFSHRLLIPDEPGEYAVEVIAESRGEELSEERTVIYQPPRTPLTLIVSMPADGQLIRDRVIRVGGMTSPRAELSVGGRRIRPATTGSFSVDIPVSERDIGDYTLDIVAADEEEEIGKRLAVTIDGASPQINTSPPSLRSMSEVAHATRRGEMVVQVVDRTPEEEIRLRVTLNGAREELSTESGGTERITLEEGKNEYSIVALDRAGNRSNVLQGAVYYLPGPLAIDILEPGSNPLVIRGLPPMPGGVDAPVLEVEVEIDDGIGDVPETIRRVVVRGEGKEVVLQESADYVYEGEIELATRKTHTFTIEVEDLAGTIETRDITVRFQR